MCIDWNPRFRKQFKCVSQLEERVDFFPTTAISDFLLLHDVQSWTRGIYYWSTNDCVFHYLVSK